MTNTYHKREHFHSVSLTLEIGDRLESALRDVVKLGNRILDAIEHSHPQTPFEGGDLMIIVKGTDGPFPFEIAPITVARDSEGSIIKNPTVEYSFTSDNDSAVKVTMFTDRTGQLEIGTPTAEGDPNVASVVLQNRVNGKALAPTGLHIAVVAGDVASADGGGLSIPGLPADDGVAAAATQAAPSQPAPDQPASDQPVAE